MTILRLAESFKMMKYPAQPSSTVTLFDGLFLKKYKRNGREILTQSSFKSSICANQIWIRYRW